MRLVLSSAFVITVAILAVSPTHAQEPAAAEREPVLLSDLLKLRRLGDVAVSPDSREIVYTATSIVEAGSTSEAAPPNLDAANRDSLEVRTHLYLVDASGTAPPRQLTRGSVSASDPAWHPAGDRIAFVRTVDGKPQIFVLPLLGGEAVQVTHFASGASNPKWSPDGSRILFASTLTAAEVADRTGGAPTWPVERPGRSWGDADNVRADPEGSLAEIRAWLDKHADDGNPRVLHRLDFLGEHDLEPELEFRHFFVVDADTTVDPVMITDGFHEFGSAEWLPDGQRVVVSGLIQSDLHPDRTHDSHLYLVSASGAGIDTLLEMDDYAVYNPKPSPNGRQIAFTARAEDDRGYAQSELGIVALDRGVKPSLLTHDFDRSISDVQWSRDGWYVYFTAPSNGGVPLYRLHPYETAPAAAPTDVADEADLDTLYAAPTAVADTSVAAAVDTTAAPADTMDSPSDTTAGTAVQIEQLTSIERGVRSFSLGRATVFFVGTDPSNPYELYASNLPFTSETQLTTHNEDWLAEKLLSMPERRSLVRDGREIDYWIMRPNGFDPARQYPLLVQIHGGPAAMWGPGEATMWHEFQFFASKGYAIVFANPRGSGGYGYEFKRANFQDWGSGPAADVLAAATAAAEEPWIDVERQVVTGGSYAGYLTAWIVAHDDRFQAAVAQRGVYDLDTFLGEGNAWRLIPSHFGGFPWETDVAGAPADTSARDTVAADAAEADPLSAARPPADSVRAEPPADSLRVEPPADSIRVETSTDFVSAESAAELLERNSPLTFVDQIETPLLIIHADNDRRTGVVQSEVLYKSLKILGRPVEYVRYPDAGHDLSRTGNPGQRLDRILRIYDFFERFIR